MSNLDVSKSSFYDCIERENEELKQDLFNKTLEFEGIEKCLKKAEQKYDLLSKQYNKLLERYHDVLNKAKQSANSFEYCLRETEELYEKAINKLKENGLYNAEEFEVEEE